MSGRRKKQATPVHHVRYQDDPPRILTAVGFCVCQACCALRPQAITDAAQAALRSIREANNDGVMAIVMACSDCTQPACFVWNVDGHQCLRCGSRAGYPVRVR